MKSIALSAGWAVVLIAILFLPLGRYQYSLYELLMMYLMKGIMNG